MTSSEEPLTTGTRLPTGTFVRRRGEATVLVAVGGVLYLTVNGHVRMALVPAAVGQRYLERKTATPAQGRFYDGISVPTNAFVHRRSAVAFFVAARGVVILTRNGEPRMAVVPEQVAREYEASRVGAEGEST